MRISFRDPNGFVFRSGQEIYRCVYPHATEDLLSFLATPLAEAETTSGTLASATVIEEQQARTGSERWPPVPGGSLILKHGAIPFPNFPYEWPPEMLHAAAGLTLRLAQAALAHGFGLKDGTPYNIMFDGPRPVFLDVLSFERRDPLDPIWRPYGQFIRTFLYPLLANRYLGLQLDELLLTHRDGLEPERMRRMCPLGLLVRPPFLSLVTIPELVSRMKTRSSPGEFRGTQSKDASEASFLLSRVFARAGRILRGVPGGGETEATRYADSGHKYSESETAVKEAAVERAFAAARPHDVLDIGSNTGRFSLLAARQGARVVAIDRDPAAVGRLWKSAASHKADILPLVVDIARPPGASGWANEEQPGFLDRARGRFDCVLMLALLHHLIVNERAPLDAIFALAGQLTTRTAIVEYVDPADAQFQQILRGRAELHRDLTTASFETAAGRYFRITGQCEVTPTRRIYTLEKAGG
ncbi:MAG TPA: class I SAM-dependent methyltransferase [Bryobacteraceae bacterium]